ncbi:MAG TPA: alpha-amylase family glycosyl hydrolase, partial [Chryseolinea sp.]
MGNPICPSLYQINTRVLLTGLSEQTGKRATLDDIPDDQLDLWKEMGFDWVWFLSVWSTGERGRKVSLENPEWRNEFRHTLSNLRDEDIGGSGFAIAGYHVHPNLGHDEALERLRAKLNKRGMKLMLDFVPNHMGPDHPWVSEHPEYFVAGTEDDILKQPKNYTRVTTGQGQKILAYGRDPYFDGWPDTFQLDYSNPATVEAMKGELLRISTQCDGVRCDMAMLILPEVFKRTWGRSALPFWPIITQAIHERTPEFCFMAEVYWDMEWTLQQQGFNYTYDKRLYDRLREGNARAVREHFHAGLDYQNKLARFLENHDEPRISDTLNYEQHKAAAMITFCSPGLRFFHQGQFEGRMLRISPHLVRAPEEPLNTDIQAFYMILLSVIKTQALREGTWQLLECVSAWQGNGSCDDFVAHSWLGKDGERVIIVANYAPHQSQCYLKLPFQELAGTQWMFKDMMGEDFYIRDGNNLQAAGL